MAAAEVYPLHPRQVIAELLFHCLQGLCQSIRVLFAQGMEMNSVQALDIFLCHFPPELLRRGSQSGKGRAGIIDRVAFLGGTLRIDPESDASSRLLCPVPVLPQLSRGIKNHMAAVFQNFLHLLLPVGRRKDMVFQAHLLISQPRLIQPAGRRPVQILSDQRIDAVHGKCFLRQQNSASGLFPEVF